MSYQLKSKEKPSESIKRIIDEQIEDAITQLTDEIQNDPEEAIHDARKKFKKIRAVLRLVRDGLDKKIYQQENACFRDAGRLLSGVRDSQVMLNTLDLLREHSTSSISSDFWQELQDLFTTYSHIAHQKVFEENNDVASVIATLKTARERIENWSYDFFDESVLKSSVKRVYKRGYEGFDQAMEQPTAENFHEWRKRAKYLWYHLRILKPIWPDLMKALGKEVHQLADYLGDDHDLAVLRNLLKNQPEPISNNPNFDELLACLEGRRAQLQLQAKYLGQRIYAEPPDAFIKRLDSYWQTWQQSLQ